MKPIEKPECVVPDTFPAELHNRPGLDRIAYRIGTYGSARRWLLRRLDDDATLADWTYRGSDDPGIALYESAAILIDLLTLYQEVYANEAYLRTATWRESVADLARLLGYRMKPAIGGTGTFAFEVTGDAPVAIPARFPLKIDLADVPDEANFQTREAATALPWLSRFSLVRPQVPGVIANGTSTLVVSGTALSFAKDDRLLVGVISQGTASAPSALASAQVVIVDEVSEWHGRTVLHLRGSLRKLSGNHLALVAFKLGRSFQHFGAMAPAQRIEVTRFGNTFAHNVRYARDTADDAFDGNAAPPSDPNEPRNDGASGYPLLRRTELALDPPATDLALGSRVVVRMPIFYLPTYVATGFSSGAMARVLPGTGVIVSHGTTHSVAIGTISDARTTTYRYGSLSGPATIIDLAGLQLPQGTYDLRNVEIDAVEGEPFLVGALWHDLPIDRGSTLAWWGDAAQAKDLLHRPIAIVPDGAASYSATVVDVQPTPDPSITTIVLDREVPYTDFSDGGATLVFGNLVQATEGKQQVTEVLGNGDEQVTFQSFEVPKGPLTYLHRAEKSPPERPEIEIQVGARIWRYVPSLYTAGPTDEVYIVRQDNDGHFWVQFGDGKTGARLPSGVDNVRISWRTGAGSFGPSKPDAKAQPGTRLDAIDDISLPGVISGGSAPETAEVARAAAPMRVQSLDRLVSLADFEAEALGIGGVERARAAWTIVDGLPMVQVTILMAEKRAAELGDVRAILATANRTRGAQRYPVQVVAGAFEYVFLDLEVATDPAFEATGVRSAIEAALGAQFARHQLGDAEYATRIEAAAQNVAGVRWAVVRALGTLGTADDPTTLAFPAAPVRNETVSCDATHVLRLGPAVIRIAGGAP